MSINGSKLVEQPAIGECRGNLIFVKGGWHAPFENKSVSYLCDLPGGQARAGHALRTGHQFVLAVFGVLAVISDDGRRKKRYQRNRPYTAVYLVPPAWGEPDNFSSRSPHALLASECCGGINCCLTHDNVLEVLRRETP